MLPIDFPQKNKVFTKPSDMTDEQCNSLSVFQGKDSEGNPIILSAWQPSYEDIQAINEGKPIWLQIVSHGLPPVCLYTENPFATNP